MGADSEVFIFDHDRFESEVVPAFKAALAGETIPAWLLALCGPKKCDLPELAAQLGREVRANLADDCVTLNGLAYEGPWVSPSLNWSHRVCLESACRSATTCPFHVGSAIGAFEFSLLMDAAVGTRCLGLSQFVGRSRKTSDYDEIIPNSPIPELRRLRLLLQRLGNRGLLVGYGYANSDGLHGWLTPGETTELIDCAQVLDLPPIPATIEAMESRSSTTNRRYEPPDGYTFMQLSLRFVINMAIIARANGKGLLWGNDFAWASRSDFID